MAADAAQRTTWLVRHAQASFGSDDYDRLSERGHRQAEMLGRWLVADRDLAFAQVVSGTQQRHVQTLAALAHAFDAAGRPLPEPVRDPDWNEFDHERVIRAYVRLHPDEPALEAARAGDRRAVHALLAAALHAWAADTLDGVPERWEEFAARVARARARLDRAPGKTLVMTSGGVIARCAQAALGCDTERTVALNLGLRNTALCQFRTSGGAWQLHTWNALPHIAPDRRDAVTYY
ncbi:MAG TPA: phosphoglycerate mutase family protein [Rudaea sp.]|nr:phosphoglycerate mutase family protein [Rudaea sp.]